MSYKKQLKQELFVNQYIPLTLFKVTVTLTFKQMTSKSLGVIYWLMLNLPVKFEYYRSKNYPVINQTSFGLQTDMYKANYTPFSS